MLVIRAEHFFWIMVEPVQKSREGLLRHLLHSALLAIASNPAGEGLGLMKRVCSQRRLSNNSRRAWAYEELCEMLVRLVSSPDVKFLFFVDALDECEPQDCLGELADEILKI
jgi:hypothetical protein